MFSVSFSTAIYVRKGWLQKIVMLTVKITQRLHLWAEFDGAFYRPHSTQARTFRLKCVHYGNVDGEYFYLTKHFSAAFYYALLFHFKGSQRKITTRKWHVWELGNIFMAWSAFYADFPSVLIYLTSLTVVVFKFQQLHPKNACTINFNFHRQIATHALSLSLCILHFLIIKYFSIIFLY